MHRLTASRQLLTIILLLYCSIAWAQDDVQKQFEQFREDKSEEFDDFRSQADVEYEAFLRQAWEAYEAFTPLKRPVRERQHAVAVSSADCRKTIPFMMEGLPEQNDGDWQGCPFPSEPPKDSKSSIFTFYGKAIEVTVKVAKRLALAGIRESHVANAWKSICRHKHDDLINDCLAAKEANHMNDWTYVMLTQKIGLDLYGADNPDKVAFFQMFILVKSGYKVRLSRVGQRLKLLVPCSSPIYDTPYIVLDGTRYYIFDPEPNSPSFIYSYNREFAEASKFVDISIKEEPEYIPAEVQTRTLHTANGTFTLNASINKNLIDFYSDYTAGDLDLYFHTPMSPELRESIYPTLKEAISGQSQEEAANTLLSFVQTAFPYMTDSEQFGFEKPNFPDETFYYPYCDCEDRAMLYGLLVNDLLGLETVLLDYPGHTATGVLFPESVHGDRVELDDGRSYLVCDPTYMGASIGMCMEQYQYVGPVVIF